jgi:hypothetical protein
VARAKKKYRWTANVLAMDTIPPKIRARWRGVTAIHLEFCPKLRRHRDEDNLVASCKSLLDGISDALGTNDHYFRLTHKVNESPRTGEVIVHITNMEALA